MFRYNGTVALQAGNYHESPTEYYLNSIANAAANQTAAAAYAQQTASQTQGK